MKRAKVSPVPRGVLAWYRYVSQSRLHANGTIRRRFGFSAVQNSCVCNVHHHPVDWRLDFDIRTAATTSCESSTVRRSSARRTGTTRISRSADTWVNDEPINGADVVVWYCAHFTHDVAHDHPGEFGHISRS
jgi:hypothetical protein